LTSPGGTSLPFADNCRRKGFFGEGIMFTFKLQPVLNYRQAVEERKQQEFAAGQKALERETAVLAAIREEKAFFLAQLKDLQVDTFSPADVSLYFSYYELCREKEAVQLDKVREAGEVLNGLREALLQAVQKRKVMDNLSEKQLQDYRKEMAGIERRQDDETAMTRFIRKQK